jgi:hypothetical protein
MTFGWDIEHAVSATPCLKQGDLIVFPDEPDKAKRTAIIVTADCDLERKKHANLVTLVSVVDEEFILERYLLPDDCAAKREQIRSFALRENGIDSSQDPIVQTELLLAALKNQPNPDRIASLIIDVIAEGIDAISIKDYKSLMQHVNIAAKKAKSFADQMASRGDIMVLPDARDLGVNARLAWVRHVWQAPVSSIALKSSDVSKRSGERRARLSSPFRYRLTQLMGQVFMDIGLPDVEIDLGNAVSEIFGDD